MYGTGLLEYLGPVPTLMSEYNTMIDFSQTPRHGVYSVYQWTCSHIKKILWHEAMRVLLNNTSFYLPQCQWNAAPCYIRAIVIKWTKWSLNCFKRAWTTAWKRFLQWFCIVRAGYLTVGEQGWGWENQITRHFMWWSVILGFWSLCL